MKALALALQLLSYMPAIQSRPADPPGPPPTGTGLLLIASCRPGEEVLAVPGDLPGMADKNGVVRITAPAQREDAGPYRIVSAAGYFDMHGTLSANESLSATCP